MSFNHLPSLPYKGLTIIISNPSRFDVNELLSGNSGNFFNSECLRPGMNKYQCHVLDLESFNYLGRRYLKDTKCVLCLGAKAQAEVMGVKTTLGENRGSPLYKDGIVHLSSYLYQDCYDLQDHEGRLNPLLNGEISDDATKDDSEGDTNAASEKSRHGRTARSNWQFWLKKDTKKAVRIAKDGGKLRLPVEPIYHIYCSSSEIIQTLNSYENTELFIDIETDSALNITCFGFSFGKEGPIYVVPCIRYAYILAYDNLGSIFRELCRAMSRNITVAHNGAGFDFLVFPFKYRLPFGKRLADTLVMGHRAFPEVEKSLGHAISLHTDLPYHKDEGVFEPQNESQERDLWSYNGKDVFGMREVYYAILSYADTVPGLRASIDQANASIRPYITAVLQGIRYRKDIIQQTLLDNDKRMMYLLRLLEAAVGSDILKEIRSKGSKSSMPSSSSQCVKYFHGICGYPVVGYGKPSKKDNKRKPSLNEKNFYKLAIKVGDINPVIDIVLAYRTLAKQSSMLQFNEYPGLIKLPTHNNETTNTNEQPYIHNNQPETSTLDNTRSYTN